MNTKLMYRTAPLSFPAIAYMLCFLVMYLSSEFRNFNCDIKRTFRYGIEGMFYFPVILGVIVAILDWSLHAHKKLVGILFCIALVVSIGWGWVFGSALVYF